MERKIHSSIQYFESKSKKTSGATPIAKNFKKSTFHSPLSHSPSSSSSPSSSISSPKSYNNESTKENHKPSSILSLFNQPNTNEKVITSSVTSPSSPSSKLSLLKRGEEKRRIKNEVESPKRIEKIKRGTEDISSSLFSPRKSARILSSPSSNSKMGEEITRDLEDKKDAFTQMEERNGEDPLKGNELEEVTERHKREINELAQNNLSKQQEFINMKREKEFMESVLNKKCQELQQSEDKISELTQRNNELEDQLKDLREKNQEMMQFFSKKENQSKGKLSPLRSILRPSTFNLSSPRSINLASPQSSPSSSRSVSFSNFEIERDYIVALGDYEAQENGDLSFEAGDILILHQKRENGWWKAELNGKRGNVPHNWVRELDVNQSERATVNESFKADEDSVMDMDVVVGQSLRVIEKGEHWSIAISNDGRVGYVPTANVSFS
eukprot:TRINITY_DN5936_c0_g1_i2.p1 TRINITY_DN5936_c0_g1~~TRINITY_DN5936_c0_g1_i2.p1  ORF type:complete len:441 (-),score=201.62 TRINITY_DN5936_c0_g1_i2:30-1352(-)